MFVRNAFIMNEEVKRLTFIPGEKNQRIDFPLEGQSTPLLRTSFNNSFHIDKVPFGQSGRSKGEQRDPKQVYVENMTRIIEAFQTKS